MRKLFSVPLIATALVVEVPERAFGGRPLNIDDAEPVGAQNVQLEAGAGYQRGLDGHDVDFPITLTYGIFSRLDVAVGLGGQLQERAETEDQSDNAYGMDDLTLGAKWKFFDERGRLPAQALEPSIKFPTADRDKGLGSGKMDYDLMWVVSKSLGEKANAHFNFGYSWIGHSAGEGSCDLIHYGVALDYQITPSLQPVAEVFAEKELADGTDTIGQFNLGIRYALTDSLALDAAVGSKIHGDAPDLTATAGLTWIFGLTRSTHK